MPAAQSDDSGRPWANPPKIAARTERIGSLPHGFVSWEPGCTRKLNCFESRNELDGFLGHDDGKPLQDWKPDDRIIDAMGQEYRLVPNTDKTRYDIEATGETWTWERLLDAAASDAQLLKKDPGALRRRVTDVPVENRIPVLMQCVDELPAGPFWAVAGLILFLVLFFFAMFFGCMWLYNLFEKWRVGHH